jgi:quinol monooxygenase YgiN
MSSAISHAKIETIGSNKRVNSGEEAMAIRHVVTIQVVPGRTVDFVAAFKALQAIAMREEGCEQYELLQSVDDPNRMVLLERWASQALLDQHTQAERAANAVAVDALIALWAPGTTPSIERYDL